ncbi:TPA: hypothetical protein UME25_002727 [Stenotrophomonas maltophilia]|uniref:hypothetical protein n=1 Tax=Stenotrophomonas TaxID=40323 RepID=UPI0010942935|nr:MULTISPECIES: hypothetical protein [Stenotrophomonas]MDQ7281570.1 hypothetical protein [Stenotrophomonas sp. Sm6012]TGW15165.1 hypothetical protein E4417_22230 [Stenotrophomonas maltophilia]HEL3180586.1 hypothetical protein [Stenotrophomonas maltophilia]
MKKSNSKSNPYKVLAAYVRAIEPVLHSAGPESEELVIAARRLSRFLAKTALNEIEGALEVRGGAKRSEPDLESLLRLSNDQISRAISDGVFSRREMELLAIHRFGVPAGSMRSFPNLHILGEKIVSMVENENAHEVIREAARRS